MNYDWIKTRSDFDEEKPAIIDPAKGTQWTYQQLNIRADNLAHHLREQGIKQGDVVGIFAPNDVAILDVLFASFKLGAIYYPINWRLSPEEIETVVNDSGVKLIFYSTKHLSSLTQIPEDLIYLDIDTPAYDEIVNPEVHHPFTAVSVEHDDIASLLYTSGTTGTPKGVMFTYESFVNNGINLNLTYNTVPDDVAIVSLPMFHVFGFNDLTIPMLMNGSTIVLQRYFNGEGLNDLMAKFKPNYVMLIPTMYYGMLIADNFNPANFENARYLIQGGSAPLPAVQKKFASMNLFLINGYGLTEAPLTTVNTPDNAINKPMSIGKPVMFTEVRVLDDTYQDVTPGEIGELAIRSKNVTPGYWNKPEETAKSFHKDFFLTGDLARLDEDGDIYIVDRKKEMIITGGENVLPSEVERVLSEHPIIEQCVVVGYDSPKFGESVAAAIILKEDTANYEQELDSYAREHLAGYKIPRMYLKITHMPLNATSKPDKLSLQKLMNDRAQQEDELA
ncbi:AMP-binding protein [Staphylococcus arlettae]|uniref:long-chain-fatty-acid--CoA ligase FadD n=1 Tax=Staphylococcus TaxID=1279 RepID=UPI001137BCF3|nr:MULTISPECIES: AMP-binding protein [Staphylococcus]KAB2477798.1 long-chain fatty acid--CoA ligase [Staphylococcus sp. CH99b_3]MCD8833763.1 AMP-binding protein [Staphylococcus arlettae]MCD8838754.1 AMP-binding protein [Staphylococcus arlettae]MCD8849642.1 AMP-binding protein [Staphylococcus arlettae]MCD8864684.1 AMP-binding protein [Staphylococcus arlettae]